MKAELRDPIVLDIGGTHIRGGVLNDKREPTLISPTPKERASILTEIFRLIERVCLRSSLNGTNIVVGCPGLISLEGQIDAALYWPAAGINLRQEISAEFGARVSVLNDANLQALAFAQRLRNGVFLTFGTGVGGSIISNGNVFLGNNGYAGEFGHVPICGQKELCKCGRIGCLDTVAAGYWLSQKLGQRWWEQPMVGQVRDALEEAGAATADVVAATATTLDLQNAVLAGHLVGHRHFIATFEHRLRNVGITVDLEYHRDSWPLAVAGATHWIERTGEQL